MDCLTAIGEVANPALRRRRLVLAAGLLVFGSTLAGCRSWRTSPAEIESAPVARAVRLVAVDDLGVIPNPPGTQGRDGGYSVLFEGRDVWAFGDTILSATGRGEPEMISNSWSWTTDLDASDGITGFHERRDVDGRPLKLLPFTAEEAEYNAAHEGQNCATPPCGTRFAIWPGAMVDDPARDRALVFYVKIFSSPGMLDFRVDGHSLAVWPGFETRPVRPIVAPGTEDPTLLFERGEPSFGSAALITGDTLHAYGCDLKGLRKPCRLGRVPLRHALERKAWLFFSDGGKWVADTTQALPVFDGNTIMSVSWARFANSYVAVYSRPMDAQVVLRTSPRLEGPWSEELPLFEAKRPAVEPAWVYDALAHPEYAQNDDRVQYVTYSRAIATDEFETRLVRVELGPVE